MQRPHRHTPHALRQGASCGLCLALPAPARVLLPGVRKPRRHVTDDVSELDTSLNESSPRSSDSSGYASVDVLSCDIPAEVPEEFEQFDNVPLHSPDERRLAYQLQQHDSHQYSKADDSHGSRLISKGFSHNNSRQTVNYDAQNAHSAIDDLTKMKYHVARKAEQSLLVTNDANSQSESCSCNFSEESKPYVRNVPIERKVPIQFLTRQNSSNDDTPIRSSDSVDANLATSTSTSATNDSYVRSSRDNLSHFNSADPVGFSTAGRKLCQIEQQLSPDLQGQRSTSKPTSGFYQPATTHDTTGSKPVQGMYSPYTNSGRNMRYPVCTQNNINISATQAQYNERISSSRSPSRTPRSSCGTPTNFVDLNGHLSSSSSVSTPRSSRSISPTKAHSARSSAYEEEKEEVQYKLVPMQPDMGLEALELLSSGLGPFLTDTLLRQNIPLRKENRNASCLSIYDNNPDPPKKKPTIPERSSSLRRDTSDRLATERREEANLNSPSYHSSSSQQPTSPTSPKPHTKTFNSPSTNQRTIRSRTVVSPASPSLKVDSTPERHLQSSDKTPNKPETERSATVRRTIPNPNNRVCNKIRRPEAMCKTPEPPRKFINSRIAEEVKSQPQKDSLNSNSYKKSNIVSVRNSFDARNGPSSSADATNVEDKSNALAQLLSDISRRTGAVLRPGESNAFDTNENKIINTTNSQAYKPQLGRSKSIQSTSGHVDRHTAKLVRSNSVQDKRTKHLKNETIHEEDISSDQNIIKCPLTIVAERQPKAQMCEVEQLPLTIHATCTCSMSWCDVVHRRPGSRRRRAEKQSKRLSAGQMAAQDLPWPSVPAETVIAALRRSDRIMSREMRDSRCISSEMLTSITSLPDKAQEIPRFYFPQGRFGQDEIEVLRDESRSKLRSCFSNLHGGKAYLDDMPAVVKALGLPLYWKVPLMRFMGRGKPYVTHKDAVSAWDQLLEDCHDPASQFFRLLVEPGSQVITADHLIPIVQDILQTHPGLKFLRDAPDFHDRYVVTVISRIMFTVSRTWARTISLPELRRSTLLQAIEQLEKTDDINEITDFFSYEHFYVIYCKFWAVDQSHNQAITRDQLYSHNQHAVSRRVIDRIFDGVVCQIHDGTMRYEDFVWFLLAEEDKRSSRSIEYWFRLLDTDGDGCLSLYELQQFYDEQIQRMQALNIEPLPFDDCICQMLDLVSPRVSLNISISDLKRCGRSHVFFNAFINLYKFLEQEQSDPFAFVKVDSDGLPIAIEQLSDWDKFAASEYDAMIEEELREEREAQKDQQQYESSVRLDSDSTENTAI